MGECIPDLVCVWLPGDSLLNMPAKKWSFRHAFFLWHLRGRTALRARTLAARAYESEESVSNVLADLVKWGLAEKNDSGSFSLAEDVRRLTGEVIAIEVKLSRWRQALEQAKNYRRFSDQSAVVLDLARVKVNESMKATFRNEGIGLYAVQGEELLQFVPPRRSRRSCPEKEYIISSVAVSCRQSLWSSRKLS